MEKSKTNRPAPDMTEIIVRAMMSKAFAFAQPDCGREFEWLDRHSTKIAHGIDVRCVLESEQKARIRAASKHET